jgi:hypothetical protein
MKKWFFWSLPILALALIYIFIPAKIAISTLTNSKATVTGAIRCLGQQGKWSNWWRNDTYGGTHSDPGVFVYNGTGFRVTSQSNNIVGIEIDQNDLKLQSIVNFVSYGVDSCGAVWQCEMPLANNPLSRLLNYRAAITIRDNMKGVMENFRRFISEQKNVYGVYLHVGPTPDTMMISSRFKSAAYPSTGELYQYFDILNKYIIKQGGVPSGYPMINVRKMQDGSFETEAAIPTNRLLDNDGDITSMRMVPGNFVIAEVKGGPYILNEAIKQSELFIADYNKSKMANSFQLLITNRINVSDTSKWITRIYIPVVN